jgi:hypothetical protein
MPIDKSVYSAPVGLAALAEQEEPIEIEIVDPEAVNIRAGDLEISIEPEEEGPEFGDNLYEYLDESKVSGIFSELVFNVDNDKAARKEWEQTYIDGLKLLGLNPEERTEPWTGACNISHPMITEAVVRFQSETITETFPAAGPVKPKIIGKETPQKKAAAERVTADMNHQLTDVMLEFRPEHEKLLWNLPASGGGFKKVYFDDALGRQTSVFVPVEDILLPYGVADARSSYRLTHVMRKTKNELTRLMHTGFYRTVELGEPGHVLDDVQKAKDEETGFRSLHDEHYVLYEILVYLDLPGFEDEEDGEATGIELPYAVTIMRDTGTVLAVRRNWREDDPLRLPRQHFVQYIYIPGFGPYGLGLFHLIGNFAKGSTSILRQLVDSGTLSNLPGGLKTRGLRIKGDDTPIAPGEWRDVDSASGPLRDNLMPLPYKEPSATLYNLLNTIVEEGRRFAATADLKISEMNGEAPVGTTLALLERQLKVLTAVQSRVHFSLKQELGLLKEIIAESAPEDYAYEAEPQVERPRARKADFSMVDVLPVSDPNASTMAQRIVQYQAALQLAQGAPQIYDLPQLHRGMLEVLGIKNADKLVPLPDDMRPVDPVTENMNVLTGKPVKAFLQQDHEAHLAAHNAMLNDPMIAQTLGQNPQAQLLIAALHAHIAEHTAFAYRMHIQQALGAPLPPPGSPMDEEMERQLAPLIAQAAQRVLQQSQAAMAQMQAQQAAQDPVLQLQAQELGLKEKELALKERKIAADAAAKADDLDLRREEMDKRIELEATKLGASISEKQRDTAARAAQGTKP